MKNIQTHDSEKNISQLTFFSMPHMNSALWSANAKHWHKAEFHKQRNKNDSSNKQDHVKQISSLSLHIMHDGPHMHVCLIMHVYTHVKNEENKRFQVLTIDCFSSLSCLRTSEGILPSSSLSSWSNSLINLKKFKAWVDVIWVPNTVISRTVSQNVRKGVFFFFSHLVSDKWSIIDSFLSRHQIPMHKWCQSSSLFNLHINVHWPNDVMNGESYVEELPFFFYLKMLGLGNGRKLLTTWSHENGQSQVPSPSHLSWETT